MMNSPDGDVSVEDDEEEEDEYATLRRRSVRSDAPIPRSVMMRPQLRPPSRGPSGLSASAYAVWNGGNQQQTVGNPAFLDEQPHLFDGYSEPPPPSTPMWKVMDEYLRTLPPEFPVERTHARVTDGTPGGVVAERIAICLRDRSVAAVYDDEKATALAETLHQVRFYVRLFRDDIGGHGRGVLVEVQRRSGCCFRFREECRAVLRTAQGLRPQDDDAVTSRTKTKRMTVPASVLAAAAAKAKQSSSSKKRDASLASALELSGSLLKKNRMDANLLGMESLKHVTDIESGGVAPETALFVSKRILPWSESSQVNSEKDAISSSSSEEDLSDAILSLVQLGRLHDHQHDDDADFYFVEDDLELDSGRYHTAMRSHALCTLANALSNLAHAGELGQFLASNSTVSVRIRADPMLSALIGELSDCATPQQRTSVVGHDPYQAARCLGALCTASDKVRTRAMELGISAAVQVSMKEGICQHALLAKECRNVARALALGVGGKH